MHAITDGCRQVVLVAGGDVQHSPRPVSRPPEQLLPPAGTNRNYDCLSPHNGPRWRLSTTISYSTQKLEWWMVNG